MKGKGLPVYFVQPTQMHKECSLATLDCYGNFFSRANDPRLLRDFFFSCKRPCCRKKIKKAINKASVLSIA